MVQPRRASPWHFLSILACLLVLSLTPSGVWNTVSRQATSPDSVPAPTLISDESPLNLSKDDGQGESSERARDPSIPTPDFSPLLQPRSAEKTEEIFAGDVSEQGLTDSQPVVATQEEMAPDDFQVDEPAYMDETETPELVAPAGKIGDRPDEIQETATEPEASPPAPLPESIRRLPVAVAFIPTPMRTTPLNDVLPSEDTVYPDTTRPQTTAKPSAPQPVRADRHTDDSWREPETLLESLKSLATVGPTSKWASDVTREIRALPRAIESGSNETTVILERLAALHREAPELARKLSDKTLARRLRKTGYALDRRLNIWQTIVLLSVPKPSDNPAPAVDPQKLALCLATIDKLTGDSDAGQAWRDYLLVDALEQSSKRQPSANDQTMRKLAQEVLERLTQTPLTSHQQKFVTSGPVAALRAELRHWAAEPVGVAAVLRDIETYEKTCLPSDARRLAIDCQNLTVASAEARRQLAERLDIYYRNANLRIAVTEELLNKMVPERNLEYASVSDTVLGNPVYGESLMATEVAVRMVPDAARVRLALEVTGKIAATTTADAGPARFHSDSDSYYMARKPLEIDMKGISTWPVEVDVENETTLRGVNTPLDGIPLLGAVARSVARSQMEQNKPAAAEEVKQKVAAQARERVDAEARQRLTEAVAKLNERLFDPLNSLSLDPQMIAGETTEKRFTMRLRLAGDDQLGSHTPRPQAPADSLASVQLHESVLNNGIQRLQLNGRTFTLPELSQHIAKRLNRPSSWEINPEHADVKITFAEKDAVIVRCRDGQVELTLSIAQLSKSPRKWKNFQIRAFYRPRVEGRSAELARDGVIHLIGQRLSTGAQIALRGIFSRALSKNNSWGLVPEQIVKEPKLDYTAVTQFVIDDGWIGVALGPKPPAATTAHRPRWGLW